jgi:hypothetical protein
VERTIEILKAATSFFDTGNARKTDATDAHAVAMVALRTPRSNQLAFDEGLIALRLLTDRRDELSQLRVQTVNRTASRSQHDVGRWLPVATSLSNGFVNEAWPEHATSDGDDSRSSSSARSRQACLCGAAVY